MTQLERNLLKTVKKNLIDSTKTDWSRGENHQWIAYARSMQNAIDSQTAILETLLSEITNPIIEPELPEEGKN